MTHRSLVSELLAWVLGALGLVWLGFVAVGFRTGLHEADELTDGHLASVAALLLSQSGNEFRDAHAVFPAGEQADLRAHDYQQSLSVVLWDATGRVLGHSGRAPVPAFADNEGFATLALGEPATAWRSFARWQQPDHARRVMVLLSVAERDDLAWDIGSQVAEPGLWVLPVVALALGLAIRRGLRPLRALTDEVHALDVQRATPLPPGQRHQEFNAVVEAINTLVTRYHAALQREQQLASELAHELRTPLASLSLHARSLRGEMSPRERELSLQRIEEDALRAGQLLSQLLALARASRAELAEAARPVDLAELARRVVADYAQPALDADHELGLDAPAQWVMPGHPVLLELALRNLIDNALAHTPRGTAIEVQLNADERWLQVCDDGTHHADPARPANVADAGAGARGEPGGDMAVHALGLGLGHRVIEKVAALHGGRFARQAAPPGFSTSYRISFA